MKRSFRTQAHTRKPVARQRAIGYDFSPLIGDPFAGFKDEGVVLTSSDLIGEGADDFISDATPDNETVLNRPAEIKIPKKIGPKIRFTHPLLPQDETKMGIDAVNHVMEQNGPVATELKALLAQQKREHYDAATVAQLAKDYLDQKTVGVMGSVVFRDGQYYNPLLNEIIPGLKEAIAAETAARNRSIDYAHWKSKIPATATSYDVVSQGGAYNINTPAAQAQIVYSQGIANQIVAENKAKAAEDEAKSFYTQLQIEPFTPAADVDWRVRSQPGAFGIFAAAATISNRVNAVLAYQTKMRNELLDKLIKPFLDQGLETYSQVPTTAGIFGPVAYDKTYPGFAARFNAQAAAKKAAKLEAQAKDAVTRNYWNARDYLQNENPMMTSAFTVNPNHPAITELQAKIDWYKNNSKEGRIKKITDRIQDLISNTAEGQAIAAEDRRIQKERDSECGFFCVLGKIIGPIAAIVLPVTGIAALVTTAASSVPVVKSVVDVVSTVKDATSGVVSAASDAAKIAEEAKRLAAEAEAAKQRAIAEAEATAKAAAAEAKAAADKLAQEKAAMAAAQAAQLKAQMEADSIAKALADKLAAEAKAALEKAAMEALMASQAAAKEKENVAAAKILPAPVVVAISKKAGFSNFVHPMLYYGLIPKKV